MEEAPNIYRHQIVPALETLSVHAQTVTAAINPELAGQIEIFFQNFTQNLGSYISELSINLEKNFSLIVAGIPGFIIRMVITVVATFFMTIDYGKIHDCLEEMIPPEKKESAKRGKIYI